MPVIASGMITSRQGWREVPYCACPAGSAELAAGLARHASAGGRVIHFVPGVSIIGADGVPDVIRGEETQIVGEAAAPPRRGRAARHAQQVGVRRGRPDRLVRDLHDGRALRRAQGAQHPRPADGRGRRAGRCRLRARPRLCAGGAGRAAQAAVQRAHARPVRPAAGERHLRLSVGAADRQRDRRGAALPARRADRRDHGDRHSVLAERYRQALAAAGLGVRAAADGASARGQLRIARAAGLL